MISQNVHIRTQYHKYMDINTTIKSQGMDTCNVTIDDDCWIGYGVTIMPGIHIHRGAVIGTGAVVTHDCNEYCVYAGIPARLIKKRGSDDENCD